MKKLVLVLSFFALISCSSGKTLDIKSPCVSNDDGPCGPKRPINSWLEKTSGKSQKSENS